MILRQLSNLIDEIHLKSCESLRSPLRGRILNDQLFKFHIVCFMIGLPIYLFHFLIVSESSELDCKSQNLDYFLYLLNVPMSCLLIMLS